MHKEILRIKFTYKLIVSRAVILNNLNKKATKYMLCRWQDLCYVDGKISHKIF